MPELLSGQCWLYWAASGATCLYLTSAVYQMQTQERNPCVRGCDCTVELSRQEKENEKREKDGGNSTVTLVLTGGGGSRLCSLSGLPSVFHYSHSLSHTVCRHFKWFFYSYSHLMPVLYQHPDRRKWRTHGNVCEPQNNTLWRERRGELPTFAMVKILFHSAHKI